MKLMEINSPTKCLVLTIYLLLSSGIAAQESAQFARQVPQSEEINDRMNLYKRIKVEQNKKELMQLLHDIADIQKQCRDKGYLCNVEGSDILSPSLMEINQAVSRSDDTSSLSSESRIVAPDLTMLGIVGGRVRFRLEDGRIEDFSLEEPVANLWEVAEISPESALLIYREQPEIKVRYQIHREVIPNRSRQENAIGNIQ